MIQYEFRVRLSKWWVGDPSCVDWQDGSRTGAFSRSWIDHMPMVIVFAGDDNIGNITFRNWVVI